MFYPIPESGTRKDRCKIACHTYQKPVPVFLVPVSGTGLLSVCHWHNITCGLSALETGDEQRSLLPLELDGCTFMVPSFVLSPMFLCVHLIDVILLTENKRLAEFE